MIMVGVPKQAAVVYGTILVRVINIDVHDMARERVEQVEPARVAGAEIVKDGSGHDVVLIVVMRNDRRRTLVIGVFVVGIDFAVMPPAVLVDPFPPPNQAS